MNNPFTGAFRSVRGPRKTPVTTASAPFTATPVGSRMTTYSGGFYNTGISEQDVELKAAEDGQASSLDPSVVGKNSRPHAIDGIVNANRAATSVIGHGLQETVQASDEQLNRLVEGIKKSVADAVEAINEHLSATRQWLVQRQKLRALGITPAKPNRFRQLVLTLLVLFAGDWGLLALGFQIMGLSDRPWIPFLAFTDDLHLAALSAVAALVYLGHVVGEHLRNIQHALEARRLAGDGRDNLPKPAVFDCTWSIAAFVTSVIGMLCLSTIRASYLKQMGVSANFWSFVGVQFLILAAAIGISFAHAINPEAKKFAADAAALESATKKREEKVGTHVAMVGTHNAVHDRRLADMALAGHHVEADLANVAAQIEAYKRRYILAQPEPAQEPLFVQHLTPYEFKDGELLKDLTGVTPFPNFVKLASKVVMDALGAAEEEISTLRAQIDQIEINKLNLPEVSELFASKKTSGSAIANEDPLTTSLPEVPEAESETDEVPAASASPAGTKLHPVPTAATDADAARATDGDADDTRELA